MKKVAFLIIGSSLFLTISCAQEGTGSSSSLNEEESSGVSHPTVSSEETVEEETLVLNVQIPTALEEGANLSIGSTLNNWDPSDEDYFASKVDDTHYRLTLSFPEERLPLEIEYKWTIQLPSFGAEDIWLGVEKASDGVSEIENRVVTLTPTASGTTEINDVVAAFRDPHAAEQPTVVGNLDILEVDAPELGAGLKRTVRVYTPSDYETSNKSYPVIYMQDGQNLFDQATSFAGEWGIDETMEERLADGLETAIVVGIDNTADRMDEYTPPWEDTPDAKGDAYVSFVKGSLKTYIDDNYRTLEDAANTMIGGSSMGGLISLDFLLHEKNKPQRVALLAPYLWPAFKLPEPVLKLLVNTVGNIPLLKYLYTPHGAEYKRIEFKKNIHSHCFDRYETYHDYYGLHPDLALGGPSFAFVKEALKKQLEIMNTNVDFTIPMLTVTAGEDHVVSTPHTINFMRKHLNDLSRPKYFNLSGAYHDLLNESDEYRNLALTYAFNFLLNGEIK